MKQFYVILTLLLATYVRGFSSSYIRRFEFAQKLGRSSNGSNRPNSYDRCMGRSSMGLHFTSDDEDSSLSSSSSKSSSSSASSAKYVSSAEKERRAEIQRRLERKNEVVLGKTSAISDAKDFELDVKATERELIENSNAIEQQVRQFTDQGLGALKCGDLERARDAFEKVYELKPNVYLWQAGIVMFYLGDTYKAAECFVNNANLYELRFGDPASEERIWRDACELILRRSLKKKARASNESSVSLEKSIITPEVSPVDTNFPKERRKVVRIARELFSSSIENDNTTVVLTLAKLRHLALRPGSDRMRWKLHAWFFLGLYYDAVGDVNKGKYCMKRALIKAGGGAITDDVLAALPLLHMTHRNWFDNDDIDSMDDENIDLTGSTNYITAIIKEEAEALSRPELQGELKRRGFKCTGYKKAELQESFVNVLVSIAATDNDFML